MHRTARLAAVGLAATWGLATASAETVNCTAIDAIPYTITSPGVYCLTGDLSGTATSSAIAIESDGVTIDLNGHTLDGASATPSGIRANGRNNLTIRNGRITGFAAGVWLQAAGPTFAGSGGHRLERLDVQGALIFGLIAMGRDNLVRGNRVADTGSQQPGFPAKGIWVVGPAARVMDNDIIGTRGTTGASGIELNLAPGSVVEGNRLTDTVNPNQGSAEAIRVGGSPSTQVNGNRIANTTGYANSTGVLVVNSHYVAVRDNVFDLLDFGIVFGAGSSGKYMGNLASGVTVPYGGGTAAGTTNY